jgi:amidohydrolase
VKEIATKTAESGGATAEVLIPYSSHYPVTFNDSALVTKMLPSLQEAAGKSNVVLRPPIMGAESFLSIRKKYPVSFSRRHV